MTNALQPKALILVGKNRIVPDYLICNGCQSGCAIDGRIPDLVPLDATASIDKGMPGDLAPPCARSQLTHLGHWQGHGGESFPDDLLSLRLFKCRDGYWVVVPGLHDRSPKVSS